MAEKQFGNFIKKFQTDRHGEFDDFPMQDLFLQTRILFQKSYPDTPT